MKKFFSLVLALVMALSLTTVAWGAATYTVDPTNGTDSGTSWTTIEGALGAASNGDTIKLLANVTLTAQIVFDKTVTIVSDAAVTVNTGAIAEAFKVTAGTLTLGEAVTLSGSNAIIEIYGGECVIEGATVTSSSSANCAIGVDVAGATLTVKYGTVSSTGDHGSAIGMVDGTVNIQGGDIFVTSNSDRATVFNHGGTVNVTGGTITNEGTGTALLASSAYGGTAVVNVSGGYVDKVATHETNGGSVAVSGGSFSVLPDEDYLVDGVTFIGNTVDVLDKKATSYDNLYAKSTNLPATAPTTEVDIVVTPAKAVKYNKTTGYIDDVGNVEYVNITGDATYYMFVNTLAEADVVLYKDAAGKQVKFYLDEIETPYYVEGVAFANFGEKCGQVDYDEDDGYDKTLKYFTVKGLDFFDVFEEAEVGAYNDGYVMYNGKLVPVVGLGVDKVAHVPVYTTKNGVVQTIECGECGLKAVKAANMMSVPKGITAFDGTWYWPVEGAAASTDKVVESAQTFDAGIAMYVGMSVMAAAGSAVVLKKKD